MGNRSLLLDGSRSSRHIDEEDDEEDENGECRHDDGPDLLSCLLHGLFPLLLVFPRLLLRLALQLPHGSVRFHTLQVVFSNTEGYCDPTGKAER